MKLQVYRDRDSLMQGLADCLQAELAQEIGLRGRATFCVPGGTTPGPVFDRLAQADLDWAKVAVLLNDERWVGEDSPRSNTRLLRERLLTGWAAKAHLIPLYADYPQPEAPLAGLSQGRGGGGKGCEEVSPLDRHRPIAYRGLGPVIPLIFYE